MRIPEKGSAVATVTKTSYPYIVSRPDAFRGRPHIDGTRIRVSDIMVQHEFQGQTAEEIALAFDHLTPAQIHSALAYYYDHKEEIRAEVEEDARLAEEYRRQHSDRVTDQADRR